MGASVTQLLQQWRAGDQDAFNELVPLVYAQLHVIAANLMHSERHAHTLTPTAVVHEAYLRLADAKISVSDRAHFFALAATVMRHILLDWAKGKQRGKRGGDAVHATLHDEVVGVRTEPEVIIEIDRLLQRMSGFDPRKVKVVEMIFFGGMTYDETAEALGLSSVTVHRELKLAKAWMLAELSIQPSANLA